MGQQSHRNSRRIVLSCMVIAAAVLFNSSDHAGAQPVDINDPEIAELNSQAQFPPVFFPKKPSFRVNGQLSYLVGLSESHVLFLTTSKRPRNLENNMVTAVVPTDGRFEYKPGYETLREFLSRVRNEIPNFDETYGVHYNDSSYASTSGTGYSPAGTSTGLGGGTRDAVPMPVYASGEPWQQTVLLNPPKIKPRPRPRPTPPPKVEEPPASTGFPTWAKYGVAAMGIAAVFVLVKR